VLAACSSVAAEAATAADTTSATATSDTAAKATTATATAAKATAAKATATTNTTECTWLRGLGWGTASTHDVVSGRGVDNNVIQAHASHALHFLRWECHAKVWHLLMDCIGGAPLVRPLGEELDPTRTPNELDIWIWVALEGELVGCPRQPHVFKVGTIPIGKVVDGRPHACDKNVGVTVIGVKLMLSPAHGIKKDGR
jgi:hypothetical protein